MEKVRPSLSATKTWKKFKPSWTIIGGSANWLTSGSPYPQRSQACEFESCGRLLAPKKPSENPEFLRKVRSPTGKQNPAAPVNPSDDNSLRVSRQKLATFRRKNKVLD